MRSYPRNSPRAAARLVTVALLADGMLSPQETDLIDRLDLHHRLGLSRLELHGVIEEFCGDLLAGSHLTWSDTCRLDPRTLAALLAEVDDPRLQQAVLALALALVQADGVVVEPESVFLRAAIGAWGLERGALEAASLSHA